MVLVHVGTRACSFPVTCHNMPVDMALHALSLWFGLQPAVTARFLGFHGMFICMVYMAIHLTISWQALEAVLVTASMQLSMGIASLMTCTV